MGHSQTGGIEAPVNTDDVCAVLGLSTHDVATLCTSSKINPWAKFKPVAWHSPDKNAKHPTYPERKWWHGNDNTCGLTSPKIYSSGGNAATNLQLMATDLDKGAPVWKYNPPGSNDWKTLDMFADYDHQAVCPFGDLSEWQRREETTATSETIHRFYIPEPVDLDKDYHLTTEDVVVTGIEGRGFGECYLGIMFLNLTGTGYIAATSAKKLNDTSTVPFNFGSATVVRESRTVIFRRKTYINDKRMFLFISPQPITHSETNGYGYPSGACPIMPLNGPFTGKF